MVQVNLKMVYNCSKENCEHKTRNNTCRKRDKGCTYLNPIYK